MKPCFCTPGYLCIPWDADHRANCPIPRQERLRYENGPLSAHSSKITDMNIDTMGHFTAVGMRVPLPSGSMIVNTCSGNDTAERGTDHAWTWSNPTNRVITHKYHDIEAVSVEALWQGTKAITGRPCPDPLTLAGDWRRGKAKRPLGAYAGPAEPLITSPGDARRRIYLPAYERLIRHWLTDAEVADRVARAKTHSGPVFLRDWDTGRGVDNAGPMSHAWVLAIFLNTGRFPN